MKKHLKAIVIIIVAFHGLIIFKASQYKQKQKQKMKVETVYLQPKPIETKPVIPVKKQPLIKRAKKPVPKPIPKRKIAPSKKQPVQRKRAPSSQKKAPPSSPKPYNKNWQQELVQVLYEKLDFPEFGKVKAKLEIRGDGRVKSIEIIGSENEKNEQYLLETLMGLQLPKWSLNANEKQTLTITFANEVN